MTDRKPTIILVDDLRSFVDGRLAGVARTSSAGVELLDRHRNHRLDELWLDHDLGGDDTIWPVVEVLERAAFEGGPSILVSSSSTRPIPQALRRWRGPSGAGTIRFASLRVTRGWVTSTDSDPLGADVTHRAGGHSAADEETEKRRGVSISMLFRMPTPVRYGSADEDSGRWLGFPFRPGDIVISARSKSGTTWMQMICALLIFQTTDLPAPLAQLSPWLDWLITEQQQVYDQLAAQPHRRFIKTHTPLDGVPTRPDVSYLVVARNPLDMAVSLYHQGDNIDRERLRQLTGAPPSNTPTVARQPLHSWLVRWVERDSDPRTELDSLPGVLWHLTDAWHRRREPNVLLVHYDDLLADLAGQMRHIAAWLGIDVPTARWPTLVEGATFAAMRRKATVLAPDPSGVLKDHRAFFRQGRTGSGRNLLSTEEIDRYHQRTADLAPPDLLAWLHRR